MDNNSNITSATGLFACNLSIHNAQTSEVCDIGTFGVIHLGGEKSNWSIELLEINSVLPSVQRDLFKCAFQLNHPTFVWYPIAKLENAKIDLISQRMTEKQMCVFSPITSTGTWICLIPVELFFQMENPYSDSLIPSYWHGCFFSVIVNDNILNIVQKKNSQYTDIMEAPLTLKTPFAFSNSLVKKSSESQKSSVLPISKATPFVAIKNANQTKVQKLSKPKPIILSFRTRYIPSQLEYLTMEELMHKSVLAFPTIENCSVHFSVKYNEANTIFLNSDSCASRISDFLVIFIEKNG